MTTINKEYLEKIEKMALVAGQGNLEKGLCVMQAVDYISSGGFSDHPKCACPLLTNYAININDRFNDEDRQKLKPLIPLLVGTLADDATIIAKKRFIMWRNVTVTYPLILDLIKAGEHAEVLRGFKNTNEDMVKASAYIRDNREAIRKIADADAYADAYAYAYAYANANANAYAYAYADADAYANAYADAYAYAYAYANANANAYAYADADAYANAYADADAYAYAYADAYAYAYAYADAYADADADADADAYAYAKKLRSAIADTAVETLRLAIITVRA